MTKTHLLQEVRDMRFEEIYGRWRRGAHRRKRERKPMTGMMLHLDGSLMESREGDTKVWITNRTDNVLHKQNILTCYLQTIIYSHFHKLRNLCLTPIL